MMVYVWKMSELGRLKVTNVNDYDVLIVKFICQVEATTAAFVFTFHETMEERM